VVRPGPGNGTSHEQRGLKQRPEHAIRASPSRPPWSPCCAVTMIATAPPATGGCSARVPTAGSGSRPAPSAPPRLPPGWPGGRMACATPRCRCGSTSAPAQIAARAGTASSSCCPPMPTASAASTRSPTARSSAPSTPRTGGQTGQPAVPRTAGLAPILSAICPPAAPIACHGPPADPCARLELGRARVRQGREFPQLRGQLPASRRVGGSGPRMAHRTQPTVCVTAPPALRLP
jgi:hypothetical protein